MNPNFADKGCTASVHDGIGYPSTDGCWVAQEFSRTQIRVGTPWADCGGAASEDKSEVGAIVPLFYGHPNLNRHLYNEFIESITGTTKPLGVVLQIYDSSTRIRPAGHARGSEDNMQMVENWADSTNTATFTDDGTRPDTWQCPTCPSAQWTYTKCYKAGTPCPLNHAVCAEEHCAMDEWREIAAALKAAGPNVKVLGFLETRNEDGSLRADYEVRRDLEKYKRGDRDRTTGVAVDGYFYNSVNGGTARVNEMMRLNYAEIKATPVGDSTARNELGIRENYLQGSSNDEVSGANVYLDRHPVGCGAGYGGVPSMALKTWKLELHSSSSSWYQYGGGMCQSQRFSGGSLSSVDVDASLTGVGGKLGLCEGDCDSDADCASGLRCFERDGLAAVPGCSGSGSSGWDYCVPIAVQDHNIDGDGGPYGKCGGDCDGNSDCQSGYECFQRDEGDAVPGCTGGFEGWDYCVLTSASAAALPQVCRSSMSIAHTCVAVEMETCESRSTNANDGGQGDVAYLDRHSLDCNAGLGDQPEWLMTSWSLNNLDPNINFDYTCCKRAESAMTCEWHDTPKAVHQTDTLSLAKHDQHVGAACGALEALGGWEYKTSGTQGWVRYSCCQYTSMRYTDSLTVFAHGEPQMDRGAMYDPGTPDVWITLSEQKANVGTWTPFSWYGHLKRCPSGHASPDCDGDRTFDPARWGAVMTQADVGLMETLLDRGYGYIYLTDADDFSTPSTIVDSFLVELQTATGGRRLEDSDSSAASRALSSVLGTRWTCDDTRMQCGTVCMATLGVTSRIVSDRECTEPKPEQCCPCYYDARWECTEEGAVCKASLAGTEVQVGDLVCEMRGTPKPVKPAVEASAKALCTPTAVTRGQRPSEKCLAQFASVADPFTDPFGAATMPNMELNDFMGSAPAVALALALAVAA
jgi:hypothetical protein